MEMKERRGQGMGRERRGEDSVDRTALGRYYIPRSDADFKFCPFHIPITANFPNFMCIQ